MLERTPLLSHKAFYFYLVATILSILSSNVGIILIGIIVGQLMGAQALSVINLCFPLVQVIYTLSLVTNLGNAIMASFSIGKSEGRTAKEYFTLAMLGNLVLGGILVLVGVFCTDQVSRILCAEASLLPMVRVYVYLTLLAAPLLLLIPGLTMFVRVAGAPRFSAVVLLCATMLSLVLAYVFIKYLDWGIAGASLSVSFGYVLILFLLLPRFLHSSAIISFVCPSGKANLRSAFVTSLPSALVAALTAIRLFAINHIVASSLGIFGIEVLGVVLNLHILATIFTTGTAQSLQPVGAFMLGQGDNVGYRFVAHRSFKTLLMLVSLSISVFVFCPELVLRTFGFELTERLSEAANVLRIVAFNYVLFAVNYHLMTVYQVMRRNRLSVAISVIQPLAIIPIMLVLGTYFTPYIWLSFSIAELGVMCVVLCLAMRQSRREKDVSSIMLIPRRQVADQIDLTLNCIDIMHLPRAEAIVEKFLKGRGADDVVLSTVQVVVERLVVNVCAYAYTDKRKHPVDLSVSLGEGKVTVCVKDNGMPKYPLKYNSDNGTDVNLLRKEGVRLDYKYVNGQNVLTAVLEASESHA